MSAVGRQARANLRTARLQAGLVTATMLAASALLTVGLATFGVAGGAYERLHERVDGAHLWLAVDPGLVAGDAAVDVVGGLPEVVSTTEPRPTVAGRIRVAERQQVLELRDWPGDDVPVARTLVVDGRAPQAGEAGLALDRNLADSLGVEAGDRIDVLRPDGWASVEVVGLTVSADMCPAPVCEPVVSHLAPGGLEAAGLVPATQPGTESVAIGLRLDDPTAHAAAMAAAEAALPAGSIVAAWDSEFLAETADVMLRIQSVFLAAFGIVAAVAAGFLVANAVGEAIRSQTRQIGLLKAVGFTRAQLAGTYVVQYLGLAAVAAAIGVAGGAGLAAMTLSDVAARFAEPAGGVAWWIVGVVPVAVAGIATVFVLLPVRRAGRVDVVTAIRTGALGQRRHPAKLPRFSAPLATAVTDLRARPTRTLLTVAGLGLATVTLAFAILVVATLDGLASDPEGGLVPAADLTVAQPEVVAEADVTAQFAAQPDIAAVRSERWVSWSLAGEATRRTGFTVGGDLDRFPEPLLEGRTVQRPGEAIVGYGLAKEHGLAVGDVLPVDIAGQRIDLDVVGIYRQLANRALVLHADALATADPNARPDHYQLLLADGADPDVVAASIADTSEGILAADEPRSMVAPVLDALPAVMTALVTVLAVIALLGVLSTVWMGVQERTRELGLLKAVGMSSRQVVGSVLAGAATMAAAGYAIGLPAGILFTRVLLDGLGRDLGFGPIATLVDPVPLALTLPLLVAVAVAGASVPARRAARIAVADALRSE